MNGLEVTVPPSRDFTYPLWWDDFVPIIAPEMIISRVSNFLSRLDRKDHFTVILYSLLAIRMDLINEADGYTILPSVTLPRMPSLG